MTLFDSDHKLPKPETGDRALDVLKVAVSSVPMVGKAGAALIDYIVTPPLTRRREEWFNELAEKVRVLEARRAISAEQLRDDPVFIDAVLNATHAALRTSSVEKRNALRNAVLNAALPARPELAVQQIFLAITDRLSDLHLVLLRFAKDATQFKTATGGHLTAHSTATKVLHEAFPESRQNDALYRLVWTELFAAGFVKLQQLENGPEGDARSIRRTTDLGDRYLDFISSPIGS